jgi:hypothetical protein
VVSLPSRHRAFSGHQGRQLRQTLAETINGLYKAEVIHRRGPWKTKQAVELATLEWVAWFNHHRLMEPLGYVPPAEFEPNYHRQRAGQPAIVRLKPIGLRGTWGASLLVPGRRNRVGHQAHHRHGPLARPQVPGEQATSLRSSIERQSKLSVPRSVLRYRSGSAARTFQTDRSRSTSRDVEQ